ncbi:aspartate aminotransferase family protein [Frankia sp. AgB1.9]|uniref:pyridoxal phosphate-dependent decarboxylase family protein n=1 Tax=unclassified Frankia TaxID=2632575 RepID=UPI001931BEBB|nr:MULTISPECIES: pyridoxal-dependent decarboxylase [unclassified Frankia]MBL7487749.1 aspartate aminotransferase family protein [Frankia sp. AgW1.1]MBL7548008.1 aspartate aminotransferase family protein [Frankia sp. AgB1.9]MBL7622733.1 aspartate aminotransferase family protein [Frankia sp. AgB1.8]
MWRARNQDELARLFDIVVRHALDYLGRDTTHPVSTHEALQLLRTQLGGDLPAAGQSSAEVLEQFIAAAEPGLSPSTSGRFFGFVTGGAYPVAVATEWLTSVWDQTPVLHVSSPAAAVVEETVAGWLTQLFGLPATTSVGITTGCAAANLIGLAAARHHVLAAVGWDVASAGLVGAPAPRVLASRGCHVTVIRAARLLGLGGQIHLVDTDEAGRMRLDHLAHLLATTHGPLIVCGEVGDVDTGAVDPVAAIAELTHAHGGWLHLDAAFGMWAAASPRLRATVPGLAGLDRADSWATDAHKWLNVPYDCGIALCAHPTSHLAALRAQADYLPSASGGVRNPMDYTPEMSRRARALVLWTTLRHLGADGVAELVERCCALARRMADQLARVDGVTVLAEVTLNQVLVRFTPPRHGRSPDARDLAGHDTPTEDAHTEAVIDAFQRGGVGWASPTRWRGRTALRLSVCNWQTDAATVDAAVDALVTAHRATAAAPTRSPTLPRPSHPHDDDLISEGTA